MARQDPIAEMRDLDLNMKSEIVCVVCGNIDRFKVKSTVKHLVTSDRGGIKVRPMSKEVDVIKPGMKMSYSEMFDAYWEQGNVLVAICDECEGPAVPRVEINRQCDRTECLGCFLCGRVSSESAVEDCIERCEECFGGSNPCENGGCRAWFMRIYYGYKISPENGFKEIERYDGG